MQKKLMVFFLILAVAMVYSLPVLAQETISGKIQAIDRVAKTITIAGTKYLLSDEVARTTFTVGDAIEATIQGNEVMKFVKLLQ